jgi:hypothetical protein
MNKIPKKNVFNKYASKAFQIIVIPIFSIFISLFLYFKITAPEGCSVLQHYFLGNGKPLVLESDYLPKSPVIINALKGMRVGEVKRVTFEQKEDWRLSYALNPFQLKKLKNGFDVYQYIKFDNEGEVYTTINLGVLKFNFKDNWVRFFKTTPYNLTYEYREE